MLHYFTLPAIVGVIGLLAMGCDTAPASYAERSQLSDDAASALQQANAADASLRPFLRNSAGYVVFAHVAKGGAVVGGSYGRGTVYAGNDLMGFSDRLVGYADLTQATVGLQAGGQEFREIVVFQSQADLDRFQRGNLSLAANLSAVALKTGAAGTAKYTDGVAVFVQPIGGLMFEAAVGGQQFTYQPK